MSQFRKYNKPEFYDKIWNFITHSIGLFSYNDSFFEFGSNVYRFKKKVSFGNKLYVKKCATIGVAHPNAKLLLGNNVTIGSCSSIISSLKIEIGNDVMIGPNVVIIDSNHSLKNDSPFSHQPNVCKQVTINNNVWIGANSIITAGVNIASGSVIGAGSVVTKSINKPGIYFGIPCIAHRYLNDN
jgi:acetyltransferase-like isoleucine patch superfamily enzyme